MANDAPLALSALEFTPRPSIGRQFVADRLVRLSDSSVDGELRLDGAVRFLQDVGTDDWENTGLKTGGNWVVRRTSLRLADQGRWPRLGERVDIATWCSGTGAAWAERRTNLSVDGKVLVEGVALWVPLDGRGRPLRIPEGFFSVYGEAIQGRKVSGRIAHNAIGEHAIRQPWQIRQRDLDVIGHVNNAAVWDAIVEVVKAPVRAASVTHHGPIEAHDIVTLVHEPGRIWLEVESDVRVSALVEQQ